MEDKDFNAIALRFSEELEKKFRQEYCEKLLEHARLGLLIGIFLYAIFGILDMWAFNDSIKSIFWAIRYAVVCPLIFLIYLFTYTPYFKQCMQASLSLALLLAGLGIVVMTAIAPPPSSYGYYTGLIVILMATYIFIPLRFIYSTLTSWAIVAAYNIAAIGIEGVPQSVLVNNNFLLISASLIGMFASYYIEFYMRRDFLQTYRLMTEREKSDLLNRQVLELKIEIDQAKRERQVAEITETDYFQDLVQKSKSIKHGESTSSIK